jgi:hypothetical protein
VHQSLTENWIVEKKRNNLRIEGEKETLEKKGYDREKEQKDGDNTNSNPNPNPNPDIDDEDDELDNHGYDTGKNSLKSFYDRNKKPLKSLEPLSDLDPILYVTQLSHNSIAVSWSNFPLSNVLNDTVNISVPNFISIHDDALNDNPNSNPNPNNTNSVNSTDNDNINNTVNIYYPNLNNPNSNNTNNSKNDNNISPNEIASGQIRVTSPRTPPIGLSIDLELGLEIRLGE